MICLDSNCIIDFLKGKSDAVAIVRKHKEEICTTEINRFEVLFGIFRRKDMGEDERRRAESFFDSLDILPFDQGCGKRAAEILGFLVRKGAIIEQNDAFIAAAMFMKGCGKIITRNTKHFSRIPEVEVIGY